MSKTITYVSGVHIILFFYVFILYIFLHYIKYIKNIWIA